MRHDSIVLLLRVFLPRRVICQLIKTFAQILNLHIRGTNAGVIHCLFRYERNELANPIKQGGVKRTKY